MTYLYIAHAPSDRDFVLKLSQDLGAANVPCWFPDGEAEEYPHLQKATHLIAILSPAIFENSAFLAALEFAKQNNLPRLPLRLMPINTLPPQLQGTIPIDFTKPDDYVTSLETLLDDLNIVPLAPARTLPDELLTRLYDEQAAIRQTAILELKTYQSKEETLKNLARDELAALVFRERDPTLKALLTTTLQLFDLDSAAPEDVHSIPSKEELELLVEQEDAPVINFSPEPLHMLPAKKYLWQTPRWHVLIGGLGILVAVGIWLFTKEYANALPLIFTALILPHVNILIRQGGNYYWKPSGAVWGNVVLGGALGGFVAGILWVASDLTLEYVGINVLLSAGYGLLVGWVSTVRV